jgi:hypothetical protein
VTGLSREFYTLWFLSTDDDWAAPYYDQDDLRCVDRELFA